MELKRTISLGIGASSKVDLFTNEKEYFARKRSKGPFFNTLIQNEYYVLSQFKKPCIRRVYNFQQSEKYTFDMDFYEYTLFQKEKDLNRYEKFVVIYGVSKAVEAILAQGFIHRDIKPSNIMLNTKNYPVLSDFGIVRKNDNCSNSGKGTPIYVYPLFDDCENLVNQYIDVYSIGVLICDLFYGLPDKCKTSNIGIITKERYYKRFFPNFVNKIKDPEDCFGQLLQKCISIDHPIPIDKVIQELDNIFVKEFIHESEKFTEFLEWINQDIHDTYLPNQCNPQIVENTVVSPSPDSIFYMVNNQ